MKAQEPRNQAYRQILNNQTKSSSLHALNILTCLKLNFVWDVFRSI
jgi:hypothetical protein